MHLITITRPDRGRWQSGLWLVEGRAHEDLVLDQLPYFIAKPGAFACAHPWCASQALADCMIEWAPERAWLHRARDDA